MCPLAPAPAPIYLPWPWQAPWNWVGFCLILAFAYWAIFIRRPGLWFMRPNTSPFASREGLVRLVGFNSLAMLTFMILVLEPSMARNDEWYHSQFARFTQPGQSCSLDTLFAISSHDYAATSVWIYIVLALMLLNILVLLVANRLSHARTPLEA